MPPYETNTAAQARLLSRFGITATLTTGDVEVASAEVDAAGPFVGRKKDPAQERAFPRAANLDGTDNSAGTVPDAVLDATALLAHHVSTDGSPPVTSKSTEGISRTYATPKVPRALTRARALLSPYFLRVGARAGARRVSEREMFEN